MKRFLLSLKWTSYRVRKRAMWRLIDWLIPRCGWHNTVLDTDMPNVNCLRVRHLVVVNSYGQEHVYHG